jgi:hypothetical protein
VVRVPDAIGPAWLEGERESADAQGQEWFAWRHGKGEIGGGGGRAGAFRVVAPFEPARQDTAPSRRVAARSPS